MEGKKKVTTVAVFASAYHVTPQSWQDSSGYDDVISLDPVSLAFFAVASRSVRIEWLWPYAACMTHAFCLDSSCCTWSKSFEASFEFRTAFRCGKLTVLFAYRIYVCKQTTYYQLWSTV